MSKRVALFFLISTSLLFSACFKPDSNSKNIVHTTASPTPSPISTPTLIEQTENDLRSILGRKCIQIFYDKPDEENYSAFGKNYAVMTANLLGHFPSWRRILIPVNKYKSGDLARCKANIYLGSYYDNDLPADFLKDVKTSQDPFMWIGYNFWQLEDKFNELTGFNFSFLSDLDYSHKTADGKPSFLSEIIYKGETFKKYGDWSKTSAGIFLAASEQTMLTQETASKGNVIAWSTNPTTKEAAPWAVRKNNFFYITEIPLSFITESDRYLIFADLLFDLLNEQPQENQRTAIVRLEDVNFSTSFQSLQLALDVFKAAGVPAHLAVIPEFRDPLGELPNLPATANILENTPLLSLIQSAPVVIWHGVTHQLESQKNPFTGLSGDDYEFWDETKNQSIGGETAKYFLDKLLMGYSTLKKANLSHKIWMTPHYKGSVLANYVFAKVFKWQIGRNVYFDYSKQENLPALQLKTDFNFEQTDHLKFVNDYLDKMQVHQTAYKAEQFFPYPIYGDRYGQNYIPENLGNVQPDLNEQVVDVRSVDNMLMDARRNLVLRDVWGSAFFHPFLLEGKSIQDNDLKILLQGLKNLGYHFVNLNDWIASNSRPILKKPIIDLSLYR